MNTHSPIVMKKILDRHAHMILDPQRTLPLKKAIERTVKKGDVVVDIGTGIGLLAFFACRAGAKRVIAIDCDRESLDVARQLAKRFGYENRIIFGEELSFLFKPKEKADVLICETVGSMAFDENILATILDGKKRFLKRGGKIIPGIVELWGALIDERGAHGLMNDVGGFDCAPDKAAKVPATTITIAPSTLLTKPFCIGAVTTSDINDATLHETHDVTVARDGRCVGVAVWPRVLWAAGCETNCSPFREPTHWKQAILEVKPRRVKRGEKLHFEFIAQPHLEDEWMKTETLWKLEGA